MMARQRQSRTRQNTRLSILNGAFSVVALGIVGTYLPLYLLDGLHASNQAIALSSALPALLGAIAIVVGAFLISRRSTYKGLSVIATAGARLLYGCLSLAPLFGGDAAIIAIYANSASSFMQGIGSLSWQALIDRLIPSRLRASYFSQRNVVTTSVGLIATLILGVALSRFSSHAIRPYQIIFIVATLAGMVEAYWLRRHQEPQGTQTVALPQDVAWTSVLRSRRFLSFVAASAFFNLGWQMAWPLYSIYQIRLAHASSLWVGLFTIAGQIGQIISFRWWGRYSLRRGNLIPLMVASAGLAAAPALTSVSRALPWLVITNFEGGIFTAGIILLLFNQLLHVSPKTYRATYIAAYNVVLGVVGFMAPELGVWLLASIHMSGALMVSAVWRLAGAFIFLRSTGGIGSASWGAYQSVCRVLRHQPADKNV